jgi:hypothetical protein
MRVNRVLGDVGFAGIGMIADVVSQGDMRNVKLAVKLDVQVEHLLCSEKVRSGFQVFILDASTFKSRARAEHRPASSAVFGRHNTFHFHFNSVISYRA